MPQDIAAECIAMLDAAGCGRKGRGNTIHGMIAEIITERDYLCTSSLVALSAVVQVNEKLGAERDTLRTQLERANQVLLCERGEYAPPGWQQQKLTNVGVPAAHCGRVVTHPAWDLQVYTGPLWPPAWGIVLTNGTLAHLTREQRGPYRYALDAIDAATAFFLATPCGARMVELKEKA